MKNKFISLYKGLNARCNRFLNEILCEGKQQSCSFFECFKTGIKQILAKFGKSKDKE